MHITTLISAFAAGKDDTGLNRFIKLLFHPWTLFLALSLAVWLPEGFNIGPFMSDDLLIFTSHGGKAPILDSVHSRLLRDIPTWLGLHITPGGFQGWQCAVLVLTVLRSILIYEIVKRITPESLLFALACGLLAGFHPVDSGFFWLNSTGAKFGLVLSLASCLCAIAYLDSGSRLTLAGMFTLQLMAGFTYPGYFALMLAIPWGVWFLRRVEGRRPSFVFLLSSSALVILISLFNIYRVAHHVGWDAKVADPNLTKALSGYIAATHSLLRSIFEAAGDLDIGYIFPAAVVFLLALVVAALLVDRGSPEVAPSRKSRLRFTVIFLGFIGLALLSYLPYSITRERNDNLRQLYGFGLFAYGAVLFVVFTLLSRYSSSRLPHIVVVALVAAVVTVSGLEKREYPVAKYRGIESLLGAIATLVPLPNRHSYFVVHLPDTGEIHNLTYIYREAKYFTYLLKFMYRDRSLNGAFYGFGKTAATVGASGVVVYRRHYTQTFDYRLARGDWLEHIYRAPVTTPITVPYAKLILIEYSATGGASLLGQDWLAGHADSKSTADHMNYHMAEAAKSPAKRAAICSMLEAQFRPAYCVHTR